MKLRLIARALTAVAAAAIPLGAVAVVAAPAAPAYAYSGQHCIDAYGPFNVSHHFCATVQGTGKSVLQVDYKVEELLNDHWCGTLVETAQWGTSSHVWRSAHGCANTAGYPSDFTGSIINNVRFPVNATITVTATTDPGRTYVGGQIVFAIS